MQYVLNDEPVTEDGLDRQVLAGTFAELAAQCQTPLVIGVYASWGMGKTSFLRIIQGGLCGQRVRCVWFNAWQHDQDAAPSLSLLHALVDALDLQQEFRNALSQVALAFGSVLLQKTTSLTLDNLQKIQKVMDEESYRVRDARSNLRNYFVEILDKARRKGIDRIVFFVDDLDRCSAPTVLKTLEAIKLYFNLEGCVFFLGIDRECIEAAIDQSGVAGTRRAQYLDKLIQLPFSLPALSKGTFQKFLLARLPDELAPCLPLMNMGLERNPRSAKRFINDLCLRHGFASALAIRGYDPRLLALLLLLEYLDPQLFDRLTHTPGLLLELRGDHARAAREIASPRLVEVLFSTYIPQYASIESYVGLTNLLMIDGRQEPPRLHIGSMALAHRLWLRTHGEQGQRAVFTAAFLEGQDFSRQILREAEFEAAILTRCVFAGADLRRTVFAGASLQGARLDGCCLRFADLREADLRDASLLRADLRGADLRHTNLRGADLTRAIGLSKAQIDDSLTDAGTRLPAPLRLPYRAGVLERGAAQGAR
jgi:hypothetical protein